MSEMRASKLGVMGLVAAAALLGQVNPAWAQGSGDPAPSQGQPTAPQPTGPTLTITPDGNATPATQSPPVDPAQDTSSAQTLGLPPKVPPASPKPLIWAGSVFFADQSVNSETVGVGKDYQSRNPSFQLWLSFRPRINIITKPKDKLSLTGRLDATKELTDGDDTTEYRQTTLGDAWLNLTYSRTLVKRNGWSTSLSLGPRVILPTSLASQGSGVYVTAGGGGGILQIIPLNRGGEWFSSARLLGSAYYTHSFTDSTTAINDDVARRRSTLNPNISSLNNQLSGSLLAEHQVLSVLDTGVQITPKLGLTVDTIFIQRWGYRPTSATIEGPTGSTDVGSAAPQRPDSTDPTKTIPGTSLDPQNYRLSIYFLASVDYQLTDELNLSVNYYNFANTIGASGNRQNMFYAPEGARFSLTATIGLDALYERIRGTDAKGGNAAAGSRVAKGPSNLPVGSF